VVTSYERNDCPNGFDARDVFGPVAVQNRKITFAAIVGTRCPHARSVAKVDY
jgi:hypothetical protein